MLKLYKQLSQPEREHLGRLFSEGFSLGDIAKALGYEQEHNIPGACSKSSPERLRYTLCRAHARACERKTTANTRERLKNDFIRQ